MSGARNASESAMLTERPLRRSRWEMASITISPQATKHESSDELSSAVANDPNAIGFIGLPYINKNHPLSITSTCGLASGPSRYAVKTETYPLARRLYLYTVGAPSDFVARDLLQFVLSDDAQSTIAEAGFVDQAIDFQDSADQKSWSDNLVQNPGAGLPEGSPVPQQMVEAFSGVIGNVRRASIAFRFESGSAQLDTRALQDIGRLTRYLSSPEMAGKQFWITGFAVPTVAGISTKCWRESARLLSVSSFRTRVSGFRRKTF
jgi:phosphate transport system substrate-binding protein